MTIYIYETASNISILSVAKNVKFYTWLSAWFFAINYIKRLVSLRVLSTFPS